MHIRTGIDLISDVPGTGPEVERGGWYEISLRMWLNEGDPIRWTKPFGVAHGMKIEDEDQLLTTRIRMHRTSMISGLFYGIEGMKVGGIRTIRIAPHLAFRETGVDGMVPPNAVLTAEIKVNVGLNHWDD